MLRGVAGGLAATGPVRLLSIESRSARADRAPGRRALRMWLAVADAPLDRYGERAIKRGLSDLDWVARAAIAHEAVVESFPRAAAVLPMKLFTIYANDARALEEINRRRNRIRVLLQRVVGHEEWGVRVVLHSNTVSRPPARRARRQGSAGRGFLVNKKAERDAAAERATRAQEIVAQLYETLAEQSSAAKRRHPGELPASGALLLDAAFLVARGHASRFRDSVAKRARQLVSRGYHVSLTGPWPPYSFMQD